MTNCWKSQDQIWTYQVLYYKHLYVDTVVPLWKGHSHQRTPPISDHRARFQMHWLTRDSKILLNCPHSREATPFVWPFFHCRRGGLIREEPLFRTTCLQSSWYVFTLHKGSHVWSANQKFILIDSFLFIKVRNIWAEIVKRTSLQLIHLKGIRGINQWVLWLPQI